VPLPGEGGQKSHLTQSISSSGFGGGVINIIANSNLTIQGTISSQGSDSKQEDYTLIGAGAGGSIKLSAENIIINSPKNKLLISSDEINY